MSEDIKKIHDKGMAEAQEVLNRARMASAMTKPWVLPPQEQTHNDKLPERYQSIGSRGIMNLGGKMLLALYPPGVNWFHFNIDEQFLQAPDVADDEKQGLLDMMMARELVAQSRLEAANLSIRHRRRSTFRSRKRAVVDQLLITGDTLEYLDSQFRLKSFKRDQYTTKRDSATDVLYHTTHERVDGLTLSDEQLAKAGVDADQMLSKPADKRMLDLYTKVEWQPRSKVWVIRQEIEGETIVESEEEVSPYFSTAFELASGDDYGRGFVELNQGDLNTLNELEQRLLEFAGTHSKMLIAKNYDSQVRDEDLQKPSGSIIQAKVQSGQIGDVAMLNMQNSTNFNVVLEASNRTSSNLARAMMMDSAVLPEQERVTATQVRRLASEIDGALGGMYAPIADDQQVPMIQRVVHMLERDGEFQRIPDTLAERVNITAATGLDALSKDQDLQRLLTFSQIISQFGEQALARIDIATLVKEVARNQRIDAPGLVKTDEQMQAEQGQQQEAQIIQQAAEKAIDTGGNIVEEAATAQTGAQP